MAIKGYVGEATVVAYDTEGTQSGLTDVVAEIFAPSNFTGTPDFTVTLNEIGATGVYKNTFTPAVAGTHVVIVSSVSSSPAIADKAGSYIIGEKSNKDLSDELAAAQTAITTAISTAETNIIANTDAEIDAIKGAGFNPSTDTLEEIANTLASVAASVGTPGSRGRVL